MSATRGELLKALRSTANAPGMGWLTQVAEMLAADEVQRRGKGARINALKLMSDEAGRLSGAGDIESSAQSIALSMATLVGISAEDADNDWERDREREKAFGAELDRLAGNVVMTPDARTACLQLLAQWITEGYDGPPSSEDYAEAIERAARERRAPQKAGAR